jgi:hypothetical protein
MDYPLNQSPLRHKSPRISIKTKKKVCNLKKYEIEIPKEYENISVTRKSSQGLPD